MSALLACLKECSSFVACQKQAKGENEMDRETTWEFLSNKTSTKKHFHSNWQLSTKVYTSMAYKFFNIYHYLLVAVNFKSSEISCSCQHFILKHLKEMVPKYLKKLHSVIIYTSFQPFVITTEDIWNNVFVHTMKVSGVQNWTKHAFQRQVFSSIFP